MGDRCVRRWMGFWLVIAAVISGCSWNSPTSPNALLDVSGTWVRTGCDAIFVTGCMITMTIAQSGTSLSGSFTWDGTSGGSLTGTVSNPNVSASLVVRTVPECQLAITGTITGDQWSG